MKRSNNLYNFSLNYIENKLIETNVTTRIGKGTSYGINYLKKSLNNMQGTIYSLKLDISKYFYNIDHNILMKMLSSKIKDQRFLKVIEKIIKSTDEKYVNESIIKLKKQAIKNTFLKEKNKKNSFI